MLTFFQCWCSPQLMSIIKLSIHSLVTNLELMLSDEFCSLGFTITQ